jgi:hypothetical protein
MDVYQHPRGPVTKRCTIERCGYTVDSPGGGNYVPSIRPADVVDREGIYR